MKLENTKKAIELIKKEEFNKKALNSINNHIEKDSTMNIKLEGIYIYGGDTGKDKLKEFDLVDFCLKSHIQSLVKGYLEKELKLIRRQIELL